MDLERQPLTEILSSTCFFEDSAPDPHFIVHQLTVEFTHSYIHYWSKVASRIRIDLHHRTMKMSNPMPRNHPYAGSYTPERTIRSSAPTRVLHTSLDRCYLYLLHLTSMCRCTSCLCNIHLFHPREIRVFPHFIEDSGAPA